MTLTLSRETFSRRSAEVNVEELTSGGGGRDVEGISIAFVREAMGAAQLTRSQIDGVLARAGITPAAFSDEAGTISPAQFSRVWSGMAACTGDELFGLDSRGMPIGSFALLCQTSLNSPTLECAINRSLQVFGLLLSDFEARLVRRDGRATIGLVERASARPPLFHLALFLMLIGYCSWLVDRRIVIEKAAFHSDEPAAVAQYRRLFCEGLQFGAAQTHISFDAKFLTMRPNRTEAQLEGFLARAPQDLLVQYRNCDSLPGRIWQELREITPDAWPSFEVDRSDSQRLSRSQPGERDRGGAADFPGRLG